MRDRIRRDRLVAFLLAAAITSFGPAHANAALEATYAVERYAEQEQPIFFLPQPDPDVLVNPGLDGVRALIGRGSSWSPEDLTLVGPTACRPSNT